MTLKLEEVKISFFRINDKNGNILASIHLDPGWGLWAVYREHGSVQQSAQGFSNPQEALEAYANKEINWI